MLELSSKFGTTTDDAARLLKRVVEAGATPALTFHNRQMTGPDLGFGVPPPAPCRQQHAGLRHEFRLDEHFRKRGMRVIGGGRREQTTRLRGVRRRARVARAGRRAGSDWNQRAGSAGWRGGAGPLWEGCEGVGGAGRAGGGGAAGGGLVGGGAGRRGGGDAAAARPRRGHAPPLEWARPCETGRSAGRDDGTAVVYARERERERAREREREGEREGDCPSQTSGGS